MRVSLLLVLTSSLTAAAADPREIVSRSIQVDEHNYQLARSYTFLERTEVWDWDGEGKMRNRRCRTFDVTLLDGSPYRRLVQRDDKPLAQAEETLEAEKLRGSIAERRNETEAARGRRLQEWEKKRQKQREYIAEVPDAFLFRLLGSERVAGRDAWVIQAEPRPGYRPRVPATRILPHLRGQLWIDQQSYQWLKVDVEVTDTISVGWILARIGKGTRASMEQTFVNGEVWMPLRIHFEGNARLALFKKLHLGGNITYRDYRKFQVESRVVPAQ